MSTKICIVAKHLPTDLVKRVEKECKEQGFDVISQEDFSMGGFDKLVVLGHREQMVALENKLNIFSTPPCEIEIVAIAGGAAKSISDIHPSVVIRKVKNNTKAIISSLRAATATLKPLYLVADDIILTESDTKSLNNYAISKGYRLDIRYGNCLIGIPAIICRKKSPAEIRTEHKTWETYISPFNAVNRIMTEIDNITKASEIDQLDVNKDALCAESC